MKKLLAVTIVMVLSVTLIGCFSGGTTEGPELLGTKAIIVTQNERQESEGWSFEQFLKHAETERQYSEMLEFSSNLSYLHMPLIFTRVLDLDNQVVSHSQIALSQLSISGNEDMLIETHTGRILPRSGSMLVDEILTIGNSAGLSLRIRIVRDIRPVRGFVFQNTVNESYNLRAQRGGSITVRANRVPDDNAPYMLQSFMTPVIFRQGQNLQSAGIGLAALLLHQDCRYTVTIQLSNSLLVNDVISVTVDMGHSWGFTSGFSVLVIN